MLSLVYPYFRKQVIPAVINVSRINHKLYLINVPDAIDGAYVYRVREKEAVEFALGRPAPEFIFTPKTNSFLTTALATGEKSIKVTSKDGFMLFLPRENSEGKFMIHFKTACLVGYERNQKAQ